MSMHAQSPQELYDGGNRLLAAGDLAGAIECYRGAVQGRADFVEALSNLGVALRRAGDIPAAVEALTRANKLRPEAAEIHNNLGNCFFELLYVSRAEEAYRAAARLAPDHASAHWNLGLVLLLQGKWRQGWAEFDWRWKIKNSGLPRISLNAPLWDGSELGGKRIVLYSEQGLGDSIQFARFVPQVAQRGGRVTLFVQRELVKLLGEICGVERIVARDEGIPPCDVQCPLMSLGGVLGVEEKTIPSGVYLRGDGGKWENRVKGVKGVKGVKVGLAWAGRREYSRDRERSIPPSAFARLAEIKNVSCFNLQKGQPTADFPLPLFDFMGEAADLADTAGVIENLDLVICADTVIAHLAGAMGKPTWVLLPFVPDWRWMLDRLDSPWYPSVRLFRQQRAGDWSGVVQNVCAELEKI